MIAFKKPRGITRGRASAYQSGAATSAAKMQRCPGVKDPKSARVYIPGEGWVSWQRIQSDVNRAYDAWRQKKAAQGVFIADAEERRVANIEGIMARKAKVQRRIAA